MVIKEWGKVILLFSLCCVSIHSLKARRISKIKRTTKVQELWFGNPIKDIILLNYNLLSWDSLKIIAAAAPFYALTRALDNEIHDCFYDHHHHKNLKQLPRWCHDIAAKGMAVPITLSIFFAFFAHNDELRITGRLALLSFPFLIFGKDIIREWKTDCALRPLNEHFDRHKRVHGGFPSGHTAEAMFMTILYGMRYGPVAYVPLGAFTSFVAITFITCNRHYASQVVAGAALGSIYAVAANKLIDSKLGRNVDVGFEVGPDGTNYFTLGYSF